MNDLPSVASPADPPPASGGFEEWIAVAAMALLVVITLLDVVTHYLSDESFAWTEEVSVFLMCC